MKQRINPLISKRKQPKQARSTELVSDVLEAALQVLATEGTQRFTMARVAEKAGVSVGSLYQYFPNKAAILFQLQSAEWRQTTELMHTTLSDPRTAPLDRLRAFVRAFIRSERDEVEVRVALDDAAPLYRDAPEAKEARALGDLTVQRFMREVLPDSSEAARTLAADLITTTLSAVGKLISESPRTTTDLDAYADAMAAMFCAYLVSLGAGAKHDHALRR